MSITFLAAFLTLAATEPDPAVPGPMAAVARIRPLTSGAAELLREAEKRSTIVAALLRSLEVTDAIVYVTDAMPVARRGAKSHLVFLSLDSTVRYLLVWLDGTRLSPTERIVSLGHELFHALEVATAPEVRDARTFVQLFRRIGWETSRDRFETRGAQDISERVQTYLDRGDVEVARLILPGNAKSPTPPGAQAALPTLRPESRRPTSRRLPASPDPR